ncbi:homeobox transcription factor [Niveomyces insectorum RCEF 264]|uniref:Homeobox transcription factor n=1 Tax=Niveomyces insectorum RCEF 264 TaxID=1081102 RepID=A0A167U5M6_9HYPO|nr:homeobox transcription factor [Niveomyces insectorum RCEF 264]
MGGTFNAVTRPNGLNPPSHAYSFPYNSDTLYLMPQLPQLPPPHHRNMSDPQAVAQASKQTEPKPRLAKDEVQLLENEFRRNPKPTSQRKREIAELLRVENPRINNWFQNRRAKQKQILRREADPKAAGDASPCASSSSDQQDDSMASEYYGTQNPSQTQQRASSAAFPCTEQHRHHQSGLCPPAADGSATHSASPSAEEYPSPKSLVFPPGAGHDLSSYAPVMDGFLNSHAHGSYASQASSHQNGSVDGDHASSTHDFERSLNIYVPFTTAADMEPMMAPVASYQSELLDADDLPDLSDLPDLPDLPELDKDFVLPTCESHERLSSPNSVQSPTLGIADLRFKSPPPPANIATRRNKGIPAMLNATALRGHPFGPKTGVDVGKRSDGAAAMRRIASATGLMPKRIQKTSLPSAPRSPLYFERNKEALMQSFQTAAASASASAAAAGSGPLALSHSTNVSPVMASETLASIQPGAAAATADASDDEQASSFAAGPQAFFGLEHTLSTPPGTPGVNGGLSSFLHHADHSVPMEASWAFLPQDEAQLTPSLGSFGSDDLSMLQSAPAYVVNSQPPTPSVGQTLSHSYFPVRLHGSNGGGGGSSGGVMNHTEYAFPGESYMLPAASAKSSPGRSKGKQYQFTPNVTPQDFFASEK